MRSGAVHRWRYFLLMAVALGLECSTPGFEYEITNTTESDFVFAEAGQNACTRRLQPVESSHWIELPHQSQLRVETDRAAGCLLLSTAPLTQPLQISLLPYAIYRVTGPPFRLEIAGSTVPIADEVPGERLGRALAIALVIFGVLAGLAAGGIAFALIKRLLRGGIRD